MSRRRATPSVADSTSDTPVRVLAKAGTGSEIRFGAAPARDVAAADELTRTIGRDEHATHEPSPTLRQRTFRLRRIAADILVMGLIAVAAFAIWPVRLGGATSYIIIKGTSMEPKFHTGDLAVLRSQDSYRKGDIVAYRIPAGSAGAGHLVIHRIIGRSHGGFLMQGDNRTTPDAWYPKPTEVLGRFRLLVPLPGIQFWALMPWICCAAIGVAVAWMMWPRRADSGPIAPEETDLPADTAEPAAATAHAMVTTEPVPVGARRLRRLEREAASRQHWHHRRRQRHSNRHPAA